MKKLILILFLFLSFGISAYAEQQVISIVIFQKGNDQSNTQPNRKPMHLPIEAFYDSDNNIVEVISDGSIEAEVFLYDANRNIIGYSSHLDTTFGLPIGYRGILILEINGENWYATAEIPV